MIILLTGPSASGKSSIMERLLEKYPKQLELLPSLTTRVAKERDSDRNSKYIHVDRDTFEQHISDDMLLEWSEHYGELYGTSIMSLHEYAESQHSTIKAINVDGAIHVKELLGRDALTIFVAPPSKEEVKSRMLERDGYIEESRFKEFEREMSLIMEFDYAVLNEDLDSAVEAISMVLEERMRQLEVIS